MKRTINQLIWSDPKLTNLAGKDATSFFGLKNVNIGPKRIVLDYD